MTTEQEPKELGSELQDQLDEAARMMLGMVARSPDDSEDGDPEVT